MYGLPYRTPLRLRSPEVQSLIERARHLLGVCTRVRRFDKADTLYELMQHLELSLLDDTKADPVKVELLRVAVDETDEFFHTEEGRALYALAYPPIDA